MGAASQGKSTGEICIGERGMRANKKSTIQNDKKNVCVADRAAYNGTQTEGEWPV